MGTLDDVEREGWLAEPPQGEHDREGALRTRALRKIRCQPSRSTAQLSCIEILYETRSWRDSYRA